MLVLYIDVDEFFLYKFDYAIIQNGGNIYDIFCSSACNVLIYM